MSLEPGFSTKNFWFQTHTALNSWYQKIDQILSEKAEHKKTILALEISNQELKMQNDDQTTLLQNMRKDSDDLKSEYFCNIYH